MHSQRYNDLIDRSIDFFSELAKNNTKDFFEQKKQFYTKEIKRPAEDLGEDIAQILGQKTQNPHTAKLFRIYRDVRFSKDKTPYNTHLHLMWRPGGATDPTWFFGASPDYLLLGIGKMAMDAGELEIYREFAAQSGAALLKDAAQAGAEISDWGPAPLKRVPKPFPPDHPQGDLLKRKALAFTCDIARKRPNGIVDEITDKIDALLPLYHRLSKAFS